MKNSKLLFRIIAIVTAIGMLICLVLSIDSVNANIFMLLSMVLLFASIITAMMSVNTDMYVGKNKKKNKKNKR